MYAILQNLHSLWAYFVLFLLLVTVATAWYGLVNKKDFLENNKKIALFTLIFVHLQATLGIILVIHSSYFEAAKLIGMGATMKDSLLRLYVVEHPSIMILAAVLVTIGFSKHKKKETSAEKFKIIAILYTIALVLVLSRIPWSAWF